MQPVYLDTAIATILVVLLFSVMAYALQEWLASIRQLRGKMLEKAVFEALNDKLNKSFGVLLYEHPQIDLLKKDQDSVPAYMHSSNFATALIDIIAKENITVSYIVNKETMLLEESVEGSLDNSFDNFRKGVDKLNHSDLKILLQSFLLNTNSYSDLQKAMETWFNQYMDRVSGWYRKKTSFTVSIIAILLVLVFNFDALFLVQKIYKDVTLRNVLVATAENTVNNPNEINTVISRSVEKQLLVVDSVYKEKIKAADAVAQEKIMNDWNNERITIADAARTKAQKDIGETAKVISDLNLPIGWKFDNKGFHLPPSFCGQDRPWWSIVMGWGLAAILISFGASFWFNLLIKLVPLRKAGIKPETESSKK